jgi:hypothetical protein
MQTVPFSCPIFTKFDGLTFFRKIFAIKFHQITQTDEHGETNRHYAEIQTSVKIAV